jgi:hypothetical protein
VFRFPCSALSIHPKDQRFPAATQSGYPKFRNSGPRNARNPQNRNVLLEFSISPNGRWLENALNPYLPWRSVPSVGIHFPFKVYGKDDEDATVSLIPPCSWCLRERPHYALGWDRFRFSPWVPPSDTSAQPQPHSVHPENPVILSNQKLKHATRQTSAQFPSSGQCCKALPR